MPLMASPSKKTNPPNNAILACVWLAIRIAAAAAALEQVRPWLEVSGWLEFQSGADRWGDLA